MPDGPETEQPEEPKPEKPDKPSKPEDLDENDCIIFSDAVLEKGLLAIKPRLTSMVMEKFRLAKLPKCEKLI